MMIEAHLVGEHKMSTAGRVLFFGVAALSLFGIGAATDGSVASQELAGASSGDQMTVGSTGADRDERYRQALRVTERFKSVWQQQPSNHAALARYLAEAKTIIDAL